MRLEFSACTRFHVNGHCHSQAVYRDAAQALAYLERVSLKRHSLQNNLCLGLLHESYKGDSKKVSTKAMLSSMKHMLQSKIF